MARRGPSLSQQSVVDVHNVIQRTVNDLELKFRQDLEDKERAHIEQVVALQTRVHELASQLEKTSESLQKKEAELLLASDSINSLTRESNSMRQEQVALRSSINALITEHNSKEQAFAIELTQYRKVLKELEQSKPADESFNWEMAKKEILDMHAHTVNSLKKSLDNLQKTLSETERKNHELEKKLVICNQTCKKYQEEIETIRLNSAEQVEKFEYTIRSLEQNSETNTLLARDLQSQLDEKLATIETFEPKFRQLTDQIEDLMKKSYQSGEEISRLQNEKLESVRKIESLQKSLKEKSSQLVQVETTKSNLEMSSAYHIEQLERARSLHGAAEASLKDIIRELQSEKDQLLNQLQILHQQNAGLQSETSIKLEGLADQIIYLKSELAAKKKDKDNSDLIIEELRAENQESGAKLRTMVALRDKWALESSTLNAKVVSLTQELVDTKSERDSEISRREEFAKLFQGAQSELFVATQRITELVRELEVHKTISSKSSQQNLENSMKFTNLEQALRETTKERDDLNHRWEEAEKKAIALETLCNKNSVLINGGLISEKQLQSVVNDLSTQLDQQKKETKEAQSKLVSLEAERVKFKTIATERLNYSEDLKKNLEILQQENFNLVAQRDSANSLVIDLKKEVQKLTSTVHDNKEILEKVNSQRDILVSQVDTLQSQLVKATHELNETKLRMSNLEGEQQWSANTSQRYQKQSEFYEKKLAAVLEQLETATSERLRCLDQCNDLKAQLAKSSTLIQEQKDKIDTLAMLETYPAKYDELVVQLDEARKKISTITIELNQLQTMSRALSSENKSLKETIVTNEKSIAELMNENTDLINDLKQLEQDNTNLKLKLGQSTTEVGQLKTDLEKVHTQKLELEALKARHVDSIDQLQRNSQVLKRDLTVAKSERAELASRVTDLSRKLSDLKATCKCEERLSAIALHSKELQSVKQQLQDALQENVKLKIDNKNIFLHLEDVKKEMIILQDELEKVRHNLVERDQIYESTQNQLKISQDESKKLQSELEITKTEFRQLKCQWDELSKQYKSATLQLADLKQSLSDQNADFKHQTSISRSISVMHEKASEELINLQNKLNEILGEKDKHQLRADSSAQMLEHLSSELQLSRKKASALESELLKQQSHAYSLQVSLENTQSELTFQKKTINELSSEKEKQQSVTIEAQKQYSLIKTELEKMKQEFDQLLSERDAAIVKHQVVSAEFSKSLNELPNLKSRLFDLEVENQTLKETEEFPAAITSSKAPNDAVSLLESQLDNEISKTRTLQQKYEQTARELAITQSQLTLLVEQSQKEKEQGVHLQAQVEAILSKVAHLTRSSDLSSLHQQQIQQIEEATQELAKYKEQLELYSISMQSKNQQILSSPQVDKNVGELHAEIARLNKDLINEQRMRKSLERKLQRLNTPKQIPALFTITPTSSTTSSPSSTKLSSPLTGTPQPSMTTAVTSSTMSSSSISSSISSSTISSSSISSSTISSSTRSSSTISSPTISSPAISTSTTVTPATSVEASPNAPSPSLTGRKRSFLIEGAPPPRNKRPRHE